MLVATAVSVVTNQVKAIEQLEIQPVGKGDIIVRTLIVVGIDDIGTSSSGENRRSSIRHVSRLDIDRTVRVDRDVVRADVLDKIP